LTEFTVTSNTIGTGNLVLIEDISTNIANGANIEYTVTNDRDFGAASDEFEIGYGTYIANGNLIIRNTINGSSFNDAIVSFSLGTKSVSGFIVGAFTITSIVANGSVGNAEQLLHSNGAGIYWNNLNIDGGNF
jgi:hypothetical protein